MPPQVTRLGGKAPARKAGPVSAWDLPSWLRAVVYGPSGTGKTTFWATFPGPVRALLCSGPDRPGELRSIDSPENRKKIDPRVITSCGELRDMVADAKTGAFKTVVLDHVSGLLDLALMEVLGLKELPALKSWGMARQQDWGAANVMATTFLRELIGLPAHVVIVAQERTFGGKDDGLDPEVVKPAIGPSVTPGVLKWLAPSVDYLLGTFLRPRMVEVTGKIAGKEVNSVRRGKGHEYCLRVEPHDVYMTKFRKQGGLPQDVPPIVDPTYDKLQALIQS